MAAKASKGKAPAKGRKAKAPEAEPKGSPRGAAEAGLAAAKAEIASAMAELEQLKREADAARLVQAAPQEPAAPSAPEVPPEPQPEVAPAEPPAPAPPPEPPTEPVTTPEPEPSRPVEPPPETAAAVTTKQRGLPWLSNVGWALGAVGLSLAAYAYWWTVDNYPTAYRPQGIPGAYLGLGIAAVGIILGIIFWFVPKRSPVQPPAVGDLAKHAERAKAAARRDVILARAGIALFIIGLLAVAIVYRQNVAVGPNGDGPAGLSFRTLAAACAALALIGLAGWVGFGVHHRVQRRLLGLYDSASQAPPPPVTPMAEPTPAAPPSKTPSAPAPAKSVAGLGVSEEEVKALMLRVDTMLATLPDDVVASFSKTSEADTYLKILGSERKK